MPCEGISQRSFKRAFFALTKEIFSTCHNRNGLFLCKKKRILCMYGNVFMPVTTLMIELKSLLNIFICRRRHRKSSETR